LLATRIITAILLGGAFTAAVLWLPTPAAAGLLGLLWLAGAWEWAGFARLHGALRLGYVALLAIGMSPVLVAFGPGAATVTLAIALLWWAVALGAIVTYPHRFAMSAAALAGLVVLWPSWVLLAQLHGSEPLGRELTMVLLVIVWSADVGAYTIGRWLGRVKLAPAVSPGKTWEGVGGGVAFAAAAAVCAAVLLELPMLALVSLAVATALVSVVGDLTVSMFKRNVGLKDSGKLLPGHGGVLDRIDSLTAAVPAFVVGLWVLNLLR
jgi:phosphatidate cytidylyltransferase